jgi:hypothetical protein
VAERGGFEPPIELLVLYRFSKPAPSATRPSLQTPIFFAVLARQVDPMVKTFKATALLLRSEVQHKNNCGQQSANRICFRCEKLPDSAAESRWEADQPTNLSRKQRWADGTHGATASFDFRFWLRIVPGADVRESGLMGTPHFRAIGIGCGHC